MTSLEFAQKMEKDGELYYLELNNKAENNGLKTLFDLLAKEEKIHYDMIESMKNDVELETNPSFLKNVKNIFEVMFENTEKVNTVVSEDALRHALSIEKESITFYMELSEGLESNLEKGIIQRIIREEQKHYFVIENLLDHISGGIIQGIVSAEFEQLDDIIL